MEAPPHGPNPTMNAQGDSRVPRAVRAPFLQRARASGGFSRFFALSLLAHTAVIAAGVAGGAAYRRVQGDLPAPHLVFETRPEPATTDSIVTASAEPAPVVENAELPPEPELSPAAAPEEPADPTAVADSFASASEHDVPRVSKSLDELIGDPRSSWRLPSLERDGLELDLARAPEVSECCSEPQPAPASSAANYVYPEVVKMARAEFPARSQRLGEQGSVLLEMTVGVDGLVKDVKIAESSGFARIDDCAVAAGWNWIFKPATRNGVPETSTARHRYTFRLM